MAAGEYGTREDTGLIMFEQPTERTLENIRQSRTALFRLRNGAVHIRWWTDRTRWVPEYHDSVQAWWELGPVIRVRYRRWYWLRFGVAIIEPMEDEDDARS